AVATFTADNSFELFINGKPAMKSDNWGAPTQADLAELLVAGDNMIAVKATNGGDSPNPAGAIGDIVAFGGEHEPQAILSTDAAWRVSEREETGWVEAKFDDSSWKPAAALGDWSVGPWNIARLVAQGGVVAQWAAKLPAGFRIRAALLPLDGLQSALGRPN